MVKAVVSALAGVCLVVWTRDWSRSQLVLPLAEGEVFGGDGENVSEDGKERENGNSR